MSPCPRTSRIQGRETVQLGVNVLKDYGQEGKIKVNIINYSGLMQSETCFYATSEADELAAVT